jgi:hypothetical protein
MFARYVVSDMRVIITWWSWYPYIWFNKGQYRSVDVVACWLYWALTAHFHRRSDRIPLRAWMFDVCAFFCVCVVLCLGRGLATNWSPDQGVLPSVNDQETEKSALCSKSGASSQMGEKRKKKFVDDHEAIGRTSVLSPLRSFQTASQTNLASFPVISRVFCPGVKR